MPLFEQVLEQYPSQVKVVFKNFPLSIHKFAQPAALAALAAAEQGKFWLYHDLLFANSKELSSQKFIEFAGQLHLDLDRFSRDMTSTETVQKLNKDIIDARDAGVSGTPAIFINGRQLKNRSIEEMQRLINEELAGRGKGNEPERQGPPAQ